MDLNWLWVVPILGILIIVHEMGHFFSAIWLGIKVEEFGIGFPPRVFAIRHRGIDFSLNWLPIGGFVKITGENGDSDDPKVVRQSPRLEAHNRAGSGLFHEPDAGACYIRRHVYRGHSGARHEPGRP